jgi:hypothetical protein
MDAQAVEQAKGRFQRADKAFDALRTATNYDEAEDAWSDFLLAASTIYTKLEQGSKAKGSSAGWFGRKKKERKDDPLLSFLHHARNSDEHGIERVAERSGNQRDLGGKQLMFNEFREHVIKDIRDGKTGEIKMENIPVMLHGPSLGMINVYDRGIHYHPPTEHLGRVIDLEHNSLIGVAALGLAYFGELVAEAETLL